MSKLENLFNEIELKEEEPINNKLMNKLLKDEIGEDSDDTFDAFVKFNLSFKQLISDMKDMIKSKDVKIVARVLYGYLADTKLMQTYNQTELEYLKEILKYGKE